MKPEAAGSGPRSPVLGQAAGSPQGWSPQRGGRDTPCLWGCPPQTELCWRHMGWTHELPNQNQLSLTACPVCTKCSLNPSHPHEVEETEAQRGKWLPWVVEQNTNPSLREARPGSYQHPIPTATHGLAGAGARAKLLYSFTPRHLLLMTSPHPLRVSQVTSSACPRPTPPHGLEKVSFTGSTRTLLPGS